MAEERDKERERGEKEALTSEWRVMERVPANQEDRADRIHGLGTEILLEDEEVTVSGQDAEPGRW